MQMLDSVVEKPRIIHVEETLSTNSLLREWLNKEALPTYILFVADFQ